MKEIDVTAKDYLWCSPHPTHYHEYLLDCMRKSNILVDSVYFQKQLNKYPWKTDFAEEKAIVLNKTFGGVDWNIIFSRPWKRYKKIVIAGWNEPTMIILLSLLALLKKPFILYSDTLKPGERKGLKQSLRGLWLQFIFTRATCIFATGQPGVISFTELGIPAVKLKNFPFLTNLEYFQPNSKKSNSAELVFFSSGRLDNAHKGYDIALDAFSRLKGEGISFRYKIAGEGPDRTLMERQIKDLGLQSEIELLGWLEPEALLEEYQKSDFFLHPSRFDPFPNAVLEAMACGLPVICSNQAGSGLDRILHGENGLLFESGNTKDLYLQLKAIFEMPQVKRSYLGNNARITAEKWNYHHNINLLKKIL